MRKSVIAALLLLFLSIASVFAQEKFAATEWQYYKDIIPPGSVDSAHGFFEIDAETYDGSAGDLNSLRVVDQKSQEVPYQIVTQPGSNEVKDVSGKIVENSSSPKTYDLVILDVGDEKSPVNEIRIVAGEGDFMRRTSVEGSDNRANWNMLKDTAYIYRFSQDVVSENLNTDFPLSAFRYYRIKIYKAGQGALQITGATAHDVSIQLPAFEQWPLTIIDTATQDDKLRTTVSTDAVYQGLPIQQIQLTASNQNHQRNVEIYSSRNQQDWVSLGEDPIFSYDLPDFKDQDMTLAFKQNQDGRYFKLVVYNYDNTPFEAKGLKGQGLVRRVVFSNQKGNSYKLYFGKPKAPAPDYHLQETFSFAKTEDLPRFSLGPRKLTESDFASTAGQEEESASFVWLFMAVIFVMFVLLIFSLTGRKSKPSGPPPPDDPNLD